jgi:hypothetical protein
LHERGQNPEPAFRRLTVAQWNPFKRPSGRTIAGAAAALRRA